MKKYNKIFYNVTLKTSENYVPYYESRTEWETIYCENGLSYDRAKEFAKELLKKELIRLKYDVSDYDSWWEKENYKQKDKDYFHYFHVRIADLSLTVSKKDIKYDF